MHVLQPFLIQCVPDPAHTMYNRAVDLLITYQHTTGYNGLIEITAEQSTPYVPNHRDLVNGILIESITEIIHDHGMIAQGTLDELVELGQSIKTLTESPDFEAMSNATQAFPDHPHDCMQRVLEMHGGLSEWTFAKVVSLVTPSCIDRLIAHMERTEELLLLQIEANIETPEIDPDLADVKRQWLIKYKDHPDMQIVMNHIREAQCQLGHTMDELSSDFRSMLMPLSPSQPKVAAASLIALIALSDLTLESIYSVAASYIDKFWDDVTFSIAVNNSINEFSENDHG